MLGLEADCVAETIDLTPFAGNGTVQEITRIDLNPRFGSQNIERNTRGRAIEHSGVGIGGTGISIQYKIVVVAVSVTELDIVGVDVLSDRFGRRPEIKGRTCGNVHYLASGHKRAIDGCHAGGIEPKGMGEDVVVAVAREIKVGVVGHIDDRGGIGSGGIVHTEGVVVGEGVGARRYDIAGETVVPVRGVDSKAEGMGIGLLCRIELILPACRSAVEGMTIVVGGEAVGCTVDSDPSVVKTVGIPPDTCAEVGGDSLIVVQIVETEHYILHCAVAVGHKERDDTSAEIGDSDLHTVGIGEGIESGGSIALAGA